MGEALGVRGAADGGNTEAQRHGEKQEMGESRARTGGNTEAQRHGEKPEWGKAGDGGKQEMGESRSGGNEFVRWSLGFWWGL